MNIKLTYTEEMKQMDKNLEYADFSESILNGKEDKAFAPILKLRKEIIDEAKSQGWNGDYIFFDNGVDSIVEAFNEKGREYPKGNNFSIYCSDLIKFIESGE